MYKLPFHSKLKNDAKRSEGSAAISKCGHLCEQKSIFKGDETYCVKQNSQFSQLISPFNFHPFFIFIRRGEISQIKMFTPN